MGMGDKLTRKEGKPGSQENLALRGRVGGWDTNVAREGVQRKGRGGGVGKNAAVTQKKTGKL